MWHAPEPIFLSVILYVCQAQCMLINIYVSVCVCVCVCVCECVRACGLLTTWYTFLFVVCY